MDKKEIITLDPREFNPFNFSMSMIVNERKISEYRYLKAFNHRNLQKKGWFCVITSIFEWIYNLWLYGIQFKELCEQQLCSQITTF